MLFNLPILAFLGLVLGFGFLIFVHELGHFLVAKWVGIKCTQFAIGFGPSVVAWRKGIGFRAGSTEAEYEKRTAAGEDPATLGETEYRLNYVPLGGYVKMLGQEDLDPAARSNDPRSYNAKPVWARACVISAGVVMNLIFGVIFFIIAFMAGVEFPPAIVGGVRPDTPAATTYALGHEGDPAYRGLQVGDRIVQIDGETIDDMLEVRVHTALGAAGEPIQLTVRREGLDTPLRYRMTPVPDPVEGMLAVGVAPPFNTTLVAIAPSSDAAQAGVEPDMELVAVGGEPVDSYAAFHDALLARRGEPVDVTFAQLDKQGQAVRTVDVALRAQPLLVQPEAGPANLAGLVPPTLIPDVVEGSAAAEAGVQAGDLVASLDGVAWPTAEQVFELVSEADGRPVQVVVQRDGEQIDLGPITPRNGRLGIHLQPAVDTAIVGRTLPDAPAAALNLPGGSRIVAVNEQPVDSWAGMQRVLGALEAGGEPVEVSLTYELNLADTPREQATLTLGREAVEALAHAGWATPAELVFDQLRVPVRASNPLAATKLGLEKTGQFMAQTYLTLLRLFQGSVKVEHLRGPVGIFDVGTKIAHHEGWAYTLFFLGLISVNLVVINFLPIPIVDGGHIVFLIIEKLKGSPPSAKVQAVATYIGLAFIGFVFILVTYHDIARKMQEWMG